MANGVSRIVFRRGLHLADFSVPPSNSSKMTIAHITDKLPLPHEKRADFYLIDEGTILDSFSVAIRRT